LYLITTFILIYFIYSILFAEYYWISWFLCFLCRDDSFESIYTWLRLVRAILYVSVHPGVSPDPARLIALLSKNSAAVTDLEGDKAAVRVVLQELRNMLGMYRHPIAHDVRLMCVD
jgi:hypothetical protein